MPHRYGGSRAVTCRPAEVHCRLYPSQRKLVFDLATPEECKAELTWLAWVHTEVAYSPKDVTHPSTNRVQRRVTSFMRRTTLPLWPSQVKIITMQLLLWLASLWVTGNDPGKNQRSGSSDWIWSEAIEWQSFPYVSSWSPAFDRGHRGYAQEECAVKTERQTDRRTHAPDWVLYPDHQRQSINQSKALISVGHNVTDYSIRVQ